MDTNARLIAIAQADPETLARVDLVLAGDDATPGDELQTVNLTEAARRLGVSRTTVYRLVVKGDLPTVQIGELERIPLRGLRDYANRPAPRMAFHR